jgi:prepilin-type N-terminal cleavage/methylation domain-containing protein
MTGRGGSDGFTLLELVIVIAIAGMILVGLSVGLRFDLRALRAQQAQIGHYAEIAAVESTLRHLIAEGHGFAGTTTHLEFVGALPAALDRPGLFDIGLGLDARRNLTVSWTPHRPSTSGEGDPGDASADLLDDVDALELGYYTRGADKVEAWQPATAKDAAPKLIRIRLRLGRDDRRRWPELLVRPWPADTSAVKLGQP